MKEVVRSVYRSFGAFGIDIRKMGRAIIAFPRYLMELHRLVLQGRGSPHTFPIKSLFPCLEDRDGECGNAKGHYFHQDLFVARRIFERNPRVHVDVGSRVDGFVGHVASFREIMVLDIRPSHSSIPNISFLCADIMGTLPRDLLGCCDSLSCLHALEHFGLGRYGDPMNYDGYLAGLDNLFRMLRMGGKLYLSVPIGPRRIEFNAHRVFDVELLLQLIDSRGKVEAFAFVDDEGTLHSNVELEDRQIKANYACWYGCGIFEIEKC